MMQTVVWVLFLLKVVYMTDYNAGVVCPDPVLWDTIGRYVCPGRKYFCLWDEIRLEFGEKCHATERLEQKGKRTVLNSGNFNKKSCNNTAFQPFTFNASGNARCVYLKSLCSEEGQIKVDFNSTVEDRQCRCNHSGGYAPLGQTKNRCYCVPSMEDCTCYKKSCGMDEVLLPNYTCISKMEEIALQTKPCSEIGIVPDRIPTRPTKDYQILNSTEPGKDYTVVIFMIVSILILCLACLCVYKRWRQINTFIYKIKNYFKPITLVGNYGRTITYYEGERVQIECEANKSGLSWLWFKNGEKIDSSDSRIIKQDPEETKYGIVIYPVSIQDSGKYSFYRKDKEVAVLEVQEVEILSPLERDYKYFVGDTIVLTCRVNTDKFNVEWMKDDKPFEASSLHSRLINQRNEYTLKIYGALLKDRGSYKFHIRDVKKSCETEVHVLDISPEELNCFRLRHFLETVAVSAMKDIFDREFNPDKLKETLLGNQTALNKLNQEKHLNIREYKLLKSPTVKSGDFDIRIMVVLMKNFANLDVQQSLPDESDDSEVADISRIMYVRTQLHTNSDKRVNQENFNELWGILSRAIIHLNKDKEEICQRLKNSKPSPEECEKYLERKNLEPDSESWGKSVEDMKNFYFESGLKKDAMKIARKRIESLLSLLSRNKLIERNKYKLYGLKDAKKLTQTELSVMLKFSEAFPPFKELNLKMLIMLLKLAVDESYSSVQDDDFAHLQDPKKLAVIMVIEYINDNLSKNLHEAFEGLKCLKEETYESIDFESDSDSSSLISHVKKEVVRIVLQQVIGKKCTEILQKHKDLDTQQNSIPTSHVKLDKDKKDAILSKWDLFISSDYAGASEQMLELKKKVKDEKEITGYWYKEYKLLSSVLEKYFGGSYGSMVEGIRELGGEFPCTNS